MDNNLVWRILFRLLIAIAATATGLANAQTTTSYPVTATCSGSGQLCNNIATIPITTTGLLQAQFVGGSSLCSNVRIHFLVDGTEVAVTGFVGASASTAVSNLGPVSSGAHILGLQAEGQVGGCNAGTLGSWAGTAQVTTAAAVAFGQPVPTLSEWGVIVLLLSLGIAGALHARRYDN